MKNIEFWFSIGSTYTYLSVTRILDVEKNFQVKFIWKPFSVRKIMKEMDTIIGYEVCLAVEKHIKRD